MPIDTATINAIRRKVVSDIIKTGSSGIFVQGMIDDGLFSIDDLNYLIDQISMNEVIRAIDSVDRSDPVADVVFVKGPRWTELRLEGLAE